MENKLGKTVHRPPWLLIFSLVMRAIHQVGAALFLCVMLIDRDLFPYFSELLLAAVSGLALLAAEGMRHRQIFREVSGVTTLGKCILVGTAVHGVFPSGPTVLIAFLVASLGAHAPKHIRHRLLF